MIQGILVALILMGAIAYLARMIYRSFQAKSCTSGCGKCTVVDFSKIESAMVKSESSKL